MQLVECSYIGRRKSQIVLACCVLHNITMTRGVPIPYEPHAQPEPVDDKMQNNALAQAVVQAHLQLIQRL